MLACFDTAEDEPCQVCPLSAYRSPRSDDDSRSGDESEHPSQGFGLLAAVSPALQSARAALSKVFPTKADLGLPNAYVFDEHSHQWVLRNDR